MSDDPITRHAGHVALSFSGGKDSLACVYLLRDRLDEVTIYHLDTGDLLPEMRASVQTVAAFAPNFVRIETDVAEWIYLNGLPTDLLPHTAHPVGRSMGEPVKTPLVSRYDCCYANLMLPLFERARADGMTLLIRGTKRADMKILPVASGEHANGMELYYPIQDWSNEQVFSFLALKGVVLPQVYDFVDNSPECARCSAWWGERRDSYLKRFHPKLWLDYRTRLAMVAEEIAKPLSDFQREFMGAIEPPAPAMDIEQDCADAVCLSQGVRVLQGNRLGASEVEHVDKLLEYMAPPEGSHVLDVGCGFGEVARLMADKRQDLSFVLLNKNPRQLELAPRGERFTHVLADMHHIPMPNASMDGAMAYYALCHADLAVALLEIARVVRPKGFLSVYDYERLSGDNALLEQWLHARVYPREDFLVLAQAAGWELECAISPGGDDRLFRNMSDGQLYDRVFTHLAPIVFRFTRSERAHV